METGGKDALLPPAHTGHRRYYTHLNVCGAAHQGALQTSGILFSSSLGAKAHPQSARLVTYCSCWSSAWTAACGSSAGPSFSRPAGGPAPSPCSSTFSNQLYSQTPPPPPQRFMLMPTRLCSGEAPPPRKGPCTKFLAMMSLPAIEQLVEGLVERLVSERRVFDVNKPDMSPISAGCRNLWEVLSHRDQNQLVSGAGGAALTWFWCRSWCFIREGGQHRGAVTASYRLLPPRASCILLSSMKTRPRSVSPNPEGST